MEMNRIKKWFWKRALRHEILSIARKLALLGGLLVILSGVLEPGLLLIALVLGVGAIILSGRLKHTTWSGATLVVGGISYFVLEGLAGAAGSVLVVIAGLMGLSTLVI